jgi:hypothetical protein
MSLLVGESARRVFETLSFYKNTVTVKYDDLAHQYFRVAGDRLILLDGATTTTHIVDKSAALVPWGCKMFEQKLLRLMPTSTSAGGRIVTDSLPLVDFEILVKEAKNAHKEHLDDAANVGKQAHFYLESKAKLELGLITEMPPVPTDPRAISCIIDALNTWDAHKLKWRAAERKVMSRELDACGTLDGLVQASSCDNPFCCPHPFENETALLDYKTSNYLYETFLYQTAFYVHAIVEEFPALDIRHRFIFKLGKEDGKFASWHCEADTQEADFRGFLHCLDLTRNLKSAKARMAAVEDEQKAYDKLMKAEARKAEKMKDCGKKDYKGLRSAKPVCVDGQPCEKCFAIWICNHPTAVV